MTETMDSKKKSDQSQGSDESTRPERLPLSMIPATLWHAVNYLRKKTGRSFWFVIALVLLAGVTAPMSAWISKLVVDGLTGDVTNRLENYLPLAIFWMASLMLGFVLSPFTTFFQAQLKDKFTHVMQLELLEALHRLPDMNLFFDPERKDRLDHVQSEIDWVPVNMIVQLPTLLRELVVLIGIVILLSTILWWLPWVILTVLILHGVISGYTQHQEWVVATWNSKEYRLQNNLSYCANSGEYAHEVKSYRLTQFFSTKLIALFDIIYRRNQKVRVKNAVYPLISTLVMVITLGFTIYIVIMMVSNGEATAGELVMVIQLLTYLANIMLMTVFAGSDLYKALLFFNRFFSLLKMKPAIKIAADPMPIEGNQFSLSLKNVSFTYPQGVKALDGVSCEIGIGETVAIVGENGSGKTTLTKLLLRFFDPDSGQVCLNGHPIDKYSVDDLRENISCTFQDFKRYPVSFRENITFNPDETLESTKDFLIRVNLWDEVQKWKYREETSMFPEYGGVNLSGGQWQKLAIARALHKNTPLMILDEPTASIDPKSEYDIFKTFVELAQSKTIILITHRLGSVKMADKILVMDRGKIIEQGNHDELMLRQGKYHQLFTMQSEWYV